METKSDSYLGMEGIYDWVCLHSSCLKFCISFSHLQPLCFAECPELASPWWRPASSCKCATAAAKASLADPCAGPRALPCLLDLAIPTCPCALDCTAQEPPMCKLP